MAGGNRQERIRKGVGRQQQAGMGRRPLAAKNASPGFAAAASNPASRANKPANSHAAGLIRVNSQP